MIDQTNFETSFRSYLISQGSSTKTQKNYGADVHDFLSWITSHTPSQDLPEKAITPIDVQSYLSALLKEQKTVATINRRLSSLRVFFRFLEEKHLVTQNPM